MNKMVNKKTIYGLFFNIITVNIIHANHEYLSRSF